MLCFFSDLPKVSASRKDKGKGLGLKGQLSPVMVILDSGRLLAFSPVAAAEDIKQNIGIDESVTVH